MREGQIIIDKQKGGFYMAKDAKKTKVVEMRGMTYSKEVPEEQKKLFSVVMDNIKVFSTGKSKDKNIGIAAIPLSLLFVDARYQGLRTHKRLKRLIDHWDEKKLGCIFVVPHKEEFCFMIVDGQGRYLAAKELGYESLQAIILMDAPEDEFERLKFEAEIFIGQDDETENIRELEKHLARVIIGDPAAMILEEMFHKYNIKCIDTNGNRGQSVLGSYPTTYKMAQRHGKHCLDFIFSIIRNAGWDNETNGYATFVTEALKNVWTTFQNAKDRERIHSFLSEELRQIDPTKFSSLARAKYLMRNDSRACCRLYIEDMVCEKLGLERPDLIA